MSAAGGFSFKTFEDGIYFFQIINDEDTTGKTSGWSDLGKMQTMAKAKSVAPTKVSASQRDPSDSDGRSSTG